MGKGKRSFGILYTLSMDGNNKYIHAVDGYAVILWRGGRRSCVRDYGMV